MWICPIDRPSASAHALAGVFELLCDIQEMESFEVLLTTYTYGGIGGIGRRYQSVLSERDVNLVTAPPHHVITC